MKTIPYRGFRIGLAAALVWVGTQGCGKRDEKEAEPPSKESHAGPPPAAERAIPLSEDQIRTQGITFAAAGPASLEKTLTLSGEIRLNANKLARVMPRFAGVAREVFKGIGDKVMKGETLAIVESNESLSPYEMKSPLSGTVVDRKITPGELLSGEVPAFIVADLGTVWLDIGVFPDDLSRIRVGQPVVVRMEEGGLEAKASISFLDPTASGESRTLHARVVLPNPQGAWKPGLFAEARITVGTVNAPVTVPKEAVQSVDGRPSVFRKTSKGMEPVAVTPGEADGNRIAVGNLAAGDTVAVGGSFLLKSEWEKASFAEDEGGDEGGDEKDAD
ncbi:MAG: efflux transporter periplasmic adaptor subunit [Fibrobacteres bacterium]|nr:efflux transporter periplasmic adaptor subunit [Fibrobacterota bacterium]